MIPTNTQDAIGTYREYDLKSQVEDASPHRLIQLMMGRAIAKISLSRAQLKDGRIQDKCNSIGDAINIINGLQASLNHKADARMSENFDALYAYMMRTLLEANLNNDDAKLEQVAGLLGELKEAWDAIADQAKGG